MTLHPIPAFQDNLIWVWHHGGEALVVDPGDAAPVLAWLDQQRCRLRAILVTHHHADHVGGIQALKSATACEVLGPAHEPMPCPVRGLDDGDRLRLLNLSIEVWAVPGHTLGHLAYVARPDTGPAVLFCGDTLFSAGCGRLFEGTPADMHHSLQRLASLPEDTQVCCAHEYTLSNLAFAQAVEPDNRAIHEHLAHCRELRQRNLPTLPSSIGREKTINPFLRTDCAAVRLAVQQRLGRPPASAVDTLAELRAWKNQF